MGQDVEQMVRVGLRSLLALKRISASLLFCSALAFHCIGSASAMEFKLEYSKDRTNAAVFARGPIESGDAQKMRQLIENSSLPVEILSIESPGGNVAEARKVAEIVKLRQLIVIADYECASACAQVIFPAGKYSMLTKGSLLGIHSCSTQGVRSEVCNEDIADFVVANGFPHGTVDMFMDLYDPSDMKWMGEIAARCFGYYHAIGEPLPNNGGKKACVDGYIFTSNSGIKTRPYGPSFDCTKAQTKVEKLLCRDKELMASDSVLGRAYDARRLKSNPGDKPRLKAEQVAWIGQRNEKCSSLISDDPSFVATREAALCLFSANEARIYELIGFDPADPSKAILQRP
ncbi:lysozyme inhibitor LprI family protein [Microvirga sp. VF16]|uniref:lysozyme inhibitor LprI family protein n=1 Tax=Microvirga sp. VF16 TaxID=2807101 RepID=UPI00193E03A6|nr:lysozyme inhibitor LprI family protein [Microvirga sp. VF16]QRM36044.1 DUF1311 domain-containing protein [Microvirga sp. VF16]